MIQTPNSKFFLSLSFVFPPFLSLDHSRADQDGRVHVCVCVPAACRISPEVPNRGIYLKEKRNNLNIATDTFIADYIDIFLS